MVLLNEPGTRAYLEKTDLLPSLEVALEEMLKTCATADSTQDPLNFLAACLMRNNPRHNPQAAEKLQALRDAAAARQLEVDMEEAKQRQLEAGGEVKPLAGVQLQLRFGGDEVMKINA